MKLEELTKQQIILLTLLVSFVTSIATGIVTVTLLGQTPPGTTQTINRIMERTVEKIVPNGQGASVVMKERTIVVKEEDLILKSIENGSKAVVRIYEKAPKQPTSEIKKEEPILLGNFVGIGVVISADGNIVTGNGFLRNNQEYVVSTYDNKIFDVGNLFFGDNVSFMKIFTDPTSKEKYVFNPVSMSDSSGLKLGQTVISISGEKNNVFEGIISNISRNDINVGSNEKVESGIKNIVTQIETSIGTIKTEGAPIFNLFGDFVALNVMSKDKFVFVSSDYINEQLKLFESEKAKK